MKALCMTFTLACLLATQAHAALAQHPDLDLATAQRLANGSGCMAAVAVLDRGGNVIVQQRGDGVGPHNTEAARLKAYTALSTKTPTRLFAERARNNPEAANLTSLGQLLLLGGGVPVYEGKQLVGAIGIAGAGGAEQDEACAVKATESVGLAIHS